MTLMGRSAHSLRRGAAVVALAAMACSSSSPDATTSSTESDAPATPTKAAESTDAAESTASAESPAGAAEVLERLRPSGALVTTPGGNGTAVLLDDGHLVTNAHVVDPYPRASVAFEDDEPFELVVVGVDLTADVAVLGPLPAEEGERPGVALADPSSLAPGSDLHLVGFPGDAADPEPTIARGVLSRRRELDEWGLDLIQTDAAIAGGQSGGALADDAGRVVGISGSSLDEQFALALSGPDVQAAIDAIVDGQGSDWSPLPAAAQASERVATFDLTIRGEGVALVPPASSDRQLTVTVDPDVAVQLMLADGALEVLALNEAYERFLAGAPADEGGRPPPVPPGATGAWTFDVPRDEPTFLHVSTDNEAPEVSVTTSLDIGVLTPPVPVEGLSLDETVDGSVDVFNDTDAYELDLAEGQSVTITAASPFGDMGYTLIPPDESEPFEADDGGGGLYDLDASGTFTATAAGRHRLLVFQLDGYATDYRLTITTPE